MKITLPDNWNEVNIEQYMEIANLEENEHKTNSVIAILSNQDEDVISKMTVESRANILTHLSWIFNPPSESEYKRQVIIDGINFFLQDYNEFTIGERIDLREYGKKTNENLHNIFSILYKPEKEVKDLTDFVKEKMMIGDVYGSLVFFWRIANKSGSTLQDYLMTQLTQEMKTMKKRRSV